jgi:hypothetical protein
VCFVPFSDGTPRKQQSERKADTRRKIIAGALALEHLGKNKDSAFTRVLWPLFDEYITRPQDRALMNDYFLEVGLKPLPMPESDPAHAGPPSSDGLANSQTAQHPADTFNARSGYGS